MHGECWIVEHRRYPSDEWSYEVFWTEFQARKFANNHYASDQTSAQVRVGHFVDVEKVSKVLEGRVSHANQRPDA